MAFSLEYTSSSEDELGQQSSRFDIVDLPSLRIPSHFLSDSSGSETATSAGYLTSGPDSPATPLSPGSSLGGEFSFINISSQTSDGASATSNPQRRKKYVKRKSYPFKKGQRRPHSLPIETSPHSKRLKVERPKTALFSEIYFRLVALQIICPRTITNVDKNPKVCAVQTCIPLNSFFSEYFI